MVYKNYLILFEDIPPNPILLKLLQIFHRTKGMFLMYCAANKMAQWTKKLQWKERSKTHHCGRVSRKLNSNRRGCSNSKLKDCLYKGNSDGFGCYWNNHMEMRNFLPVAKAVELLVQISTKDGQKQNFTHSQVLFLDYVNIVLVWLSNDF